MGSQQAAAALGEAAGAYPSQLGAAALDALPAHVALLDQSGIIRATNLAWNRFAAANGLCDPGFGIGSSYLQVCDAATGDAIEASLVVGEGLRRVLAGQKGELPQLSYTCHAPHEQRWFAVQAARLPGGGAIVLHTDVTTICREAEAARRMALHDPLTGLPNRLLLQDRLEQALYQAQRRGSMVGVLLIDLDGFKAVNDRYGHDAGDRVLGFVATRMSRRLRAMDTLARLGGDEFVAVLPGLGSAGDLARVAGDLLEHAQVSAACVGVPVVPRLSVGAALYPSEALSAAHLLRRADRAMYRAKRRGGSCIMGAERLRRA